MDEALPPMHSPLLDSQPTSPAADLDLRAIETLVAEQIGRKSGAAQGEIRGTTVFAVQRVPLSPAGVGVGLAPAVDWLARRIRETGSSTFRVSVRRQTTNLVLVAEWSRRPEPRGTFPHPRR